MNEGGGIHVEGIHVLVAEERNEERKKEREEEEEEKQEREE